MKKLVGKIFRPPQKNGVEKWAKKFLAYFSDPTDPTDPTGSDQNRPIFSISPNIFRRRRSAVGPRDTNMVS
jgi:hypothetical protein